MIKIIEKCFTFHIGIAINTMGAQIISEQIRCLAMNGYKMISNTLNFILIGMP